MNASQLTLCSLLSVAVLASTACGIDDADRCGEAGLVYEAEFGRCSAPPQDAPDAGMAAMDAGTSSTADAGAGGSVTGPGVGDACTSDADCAGKMADFCLLDPSMPGAPGICTVDGCAAAADCVAPDFACCDCAGVAFISWPEPTCVPAASAAQVGGLGCSCN